MADIRETLTIEDRFSSAFTSYINLGEQAAGATKSVTAAQGEVVYAMRGADDAADGLSKTLKRLAASYLSIQGLGKLIGAADAMAQTTARLDRMNDGLQTTEELQNMIYQSAMRSRGAYADTADFVAKLGTLAGEAFDSNGELVAFAEQINKQMVLSGASAAGGQAAMLQLTQALSSGVLRGEELNSVLEQTPMIAQTIANYMGVTTGEMRELASEGAITAEVVKNAMLSAAAETDAAFAQMPLTWSQLWTQAQNVLLNGFQPVLAFVSSLPQLIVDNYDVVLALFLGIAAALALMGVKALIAGAATAASFVMAYWPLMLLIAGVSTLVYGMMQAGMTADDILGGIGAGFGFLYAFVGNGVVTLYNLWASFAEFFANALDNPLQAAANLFFDFVDTILSLLQTAAGAIDAIFGNNNYLSNIVGGWRSSLSQWVSDTVGDNAVQIQRMEYIDYSAAMSDFEAIGRGFGGGLGDLGGGLSNETGFSYDALSYNDIAGKLDGISNDTSALRKEVALEQEDIKSLVDMAERRYVNNINLQSVTPVINIHGQNTGSTEADRRALGNAIRDIILEQAASASVVSTARTT